MIQFGKLGTSIFLSILLIATLGFGIMAFALVNMEERRRKEQVETLTSTIVLLQERTGLNITLSPEIRSTAVLGKVSSVELVFRPADIIAALNAQSDTLSKRLTITQSP